MLYPGSPARRNPAGGDQTGCRSCEREPMRRARLRRSWQGDASAKAVEIDGYADALNAGTCRRKSGAAGC